MDVTAVVPVMAGGADIEHVGKEPDAVENTAHVRATVPWNALVGVIVIEEDPDVPGEVMLTGPAARVKPGTGVAVTRTEVLVVAIVLPEVPVIFMVYVAVGVNAVVLIVKEVLTEGSPTTLALAAEQVGALASSGGFVTVQVSTTLPVNPSLGATIRLEVALFPGSAMATGVALIAKPGTPGPIPFVIERVVEDGWYVASPEYAIVIAFAPGSRRLLLADMRAEEISLLPGANTIVSTIYPEVSKLTVPVGAALPD